MPEISFERADAKRTVGHRRDGWPRVDRRRDRLRCWLCRRPVRVEKRRRRDEKQVTGDRPAEVENAVVIARRPADEHVLQHQFDGSRRTAVADEIGPELNLPDPTKGHVVANDLNLLAVLDDRVERIVRRTRPDRWGALE